MTRVDELVRHVRRLGNHELNELLLQLPTPCFAALVEVALAWPLLPVGLVLRFEAAPGVDGWTVVACAPRRRLGLLTRDRDPQGRVAYRAWSRSGAPVQVNGISSWRRRGDAAARPGLGDPGERGPLPSSGRLCPDPPGRGRAQPAAGAAAGSVRPAGGGCLPARGDGRMTAIKRCPRCGQLKSAEEFYRRGRGRRLSSYCQPCTQAASHQARGRRRQDPAAVELLRRWTGLASAATGPSAARVVMAGDRRTSARA